MSTSNNESSSSLSNAVPMRHHNEASSSYSSQSGGSALLIIDVQYDFMKGGSLEIANANDILDVINSLRLNCDSRFDMVILSQDYHPQNHISFASHHHMKPFQSITLSNTSTQRDDTKDESNNNDIQQQQVLWPDHCVEGSHGADIHHQLKTKPTDKIVRKGMNHNVDSYSAFYDNNHMVKTELDSILHQHNIKNVYVCGLATDYCVSYTCLDAVSLGYKTTLLLDACRGVSQSTIDTQLKKLKKKNVRIANTIDMFQYSPHL